MANKTRALAKNVPGRFFVDETCINCDNCRDVAPSIFSEADFGQEDLRAYVVKQPDSPAEEDLAALALLQCPEGAIGVMTPGHIDQARIFQRFPEPVEDEVYWLGHNSPKTFGGKAYFIRHPDGNWMVDGPRFHPSLVKSLEEQGGLQYIFLTHRDDVGDADRFAQHFGAKRIIHEQDLCAQRDAETVLTTFAPTSFGDDFVILGTPGHTEGHCMLVYKKKFLFSGDTLTSRVRFDEPVEAWSPLYCWYDWDTLTASLERLVEVEFEWLLPGHGRRAKLPRGTSSEAMKQAVARCKAEVDKDPIAYRRLVIFEAISSHMTDPVQRQRYRDKAARSRAALPSSD